MMTKAQIAAISAAVSIAVRAVGIDTIKNGPFFGIGEVRVKGT